MIIDFVYFRILTFLLILRRETISRLAVGLVHFCSKKLPDYGTAVPRHVAVLYLFFNVLYQVYKLMY
jgi:hypothetical protein